MTKIKTRKCANYGLTIFAFGFAGDGEWRVHASSCQSTGGHHFQRWTQCSQWGAGLQCSP